MTVLSLGPGYDLGEPLYVGLILSRSRLATIRVPNIEVPLSTILKN